ncbi:MAG: bifunctional DNA-formamidopyrimidine glycosylase/DNA-(apurinic or apyrimidinic site) lyase [Methanobacteriota archaeon]|nr:MAG: bifunctional DNA-formamidopyrimidine glycosylase/DNA-(apurinic or apyrimidinic site) lyase [Euryarchaeota archaeon]
MPEGPEVEVVRRGLLRAKGKKIVEARFSDHPKYRYLQSENFIGTSIQDIERFGKFLVWRFENGLKVLNHLGMTGIWRLLAGNLKDHNLSHQKVIFQLEGKEWLVFEDTRIFGKFEIINELPSSIKALGPDILKENFDLPEFIRRVRGKGKKPRRQEIGKLLLDQTVVAGCGNIYKSESLFQAGISPFREANQLKDEELKVLAESLIEVANRALSSGGSTLRDFSSVEGYAGLMQNEFLVYGQEGKPCHRCSTRIEKKKQGGRSTFYCPNCQF